MSVRINDAILAALGADRFEYWAPYAFRVGDEWAGPSDLSTARERWREVRQSNNSQSIQSDRDFSVASKIFQARIVLEAYGTASPFRRFKRFPDVKPLDFDDWLRSQVTLHGSSHSGRQKDDYAAYCKRWFQEYNKEIDRICEKVIGFLQKLSSYNRDFPAFRPDLFNPPPQYESCIDITNQRFVKCPVCGFTLAVLREQGRTYIGPVEWAEAYEEDYLEVWKIIRPELLDCPVCLLQLNGNDELEVVGLDQAWNENGPLSL